MATARAVFAVLGFLVAVVGLATAWTVDRLAGMVVLIVGAFLMILPFTRTQDDE